MGLSGRIRYNEVSGRVAAERDGAQAFPEVCFAVAGRAMPFIGLRLEPIGTVARPVRRVPPFNSSMRRVRTGIHKIGTGVAQQSFDLLDRSPNYTARLAGLNLAL